MRFGKSAAEAEKEPSRGGGGIDFIKYLRDGDTTFRLLQEPDDWLYYWEHFSPAGFSFACPRDVDDPVEDCPGCSSDSEKMSKVSRRVAFNVLQGFNGQDYVNVYKVGNTVADKLKNRYARFGTVMDRDYTITKYKTSGDRVDFDVEGGTPTPIDPSKYELRDIEAMLLEQWNENWGDPVQAEANQREAAQATREEEVGRRVRATIAPSTKVEEPPFEKPQEQKVYQEDDLRGMEYEELLVLIKNDMGETPPRGAETTDQVVDWLMGLQG